MVLKLQLAAALAWALPAHLHCASVLACSTSFIVVRHLQLIVAVVVITSVLHSIARNYSLHGAPHSPSALLTDVNAANHLWQDATGPTLSACIGKGSKGRKAAHRSFLLASVHARLSAIACKPPDRGCDVMVLWCSVTLCPKPLNDIGPKEAQSLAS